MSDQPSTETVEKKNESNTQDVKDENKEQDSWKNGEKFDAEKAQALIEKLREEAKGKKALEKKVSEFETKEKELAQKDMTELQKAQLRLDELEKENKAIKRSQMQRTATDKFKLPSEFAELLPGETLEEMEAKAESLSKALPKQNNLPNLNPTNPNGNVSETRDQKKARLAGGSTDIFARGGGVNFVD